MVFLPNTKTGKTVPVDAETVKEEDTEYDGTRHVSHFKTCTHPQEFSRHKR